MKSSIEIQERHRNTTFATGVKQLIYSGQSAYQRIEIADTHDWGRMLLLDGMMMLSERDEFFYHESIVHLPMALRPSIQKVLVIGGGDGGVARELAKYTEIKQIDVVEIDADVIRLCQEHLPFVACGFDDHRVQVHTQDAAAFIRDLATASYDLVISDSSDPYAFAEVLFSQDFFAEIARILTPEGLLIAQNSSPLSQSTEMQTGYTNCQQAFGHHQLAWSIVPTYPGCLWSFNLAGHQPLATQIYDKKVPDCRFFSVGLVPALLQLPLFVSEMLG